ncbi:hypothetical protein O6H91_01G175600 [Diphasiastrum complanatum]|uniref:Uncharacterized protein n=1 Tax=Diphasiastrum complanatum TaxID=34168 RepID=A0ACC2EZ33_DIPCM|nr:hypothetical protein O6H91_01G175600 [Diphasiastrum complanatum]
MLLWIVIIFYQSLLLSVVAAATSTSTVVVSAVCFPSLFRSSSHLCSFEPWHTSLSLGIAAAGCGTQLGWACAAAAAGSSIGSGSASASCACAYAAWRYPSHMVVQPQEEAEVHLCSSAMAIAAAFKKVSAPSAAMKLKLTRLANDFSENDLFCGPSNEFLALCKEQLNLCPTFLSSHVNFTVYVRSAESYSSGEMKLRRVLFHGSNSMEEAEFENEYVALLNLESECHTSIRDAELALAECRAVELPESGALVLPMAKDSFLVGILVAEWLSHKPEKVKLDGEEEEFLSVSPLQQRARLIPSTKGTFDMEHPTELIQTARCLALACVLDQRAVLLQQSSWKKGVRIDNLFEQAQGPLTTIRTLGKMLLPMLKRGEISHDVVEDIIVQGDRMKDILRLIQENGARLIQLRQNVNAILENPRKPSRWGVFGPTIRSGPNLGELHNSLGENPSCSTQALASTSPPVGRDKELPMPPMTLAPLYNRNLRTCDVADVLLKLVKAANGLALTKNQTLQLNSPHAFPLIAAVEEDILHHALSRLLDGVLQHSPSGGWVRAEVMQAPGGGVLVLIEDNGPDMSVVREGFRTETFRGLITIRLL